MLSLLPDIIGVTAWLYLVIRVSVWIVWRSRLIRQPLLLFPFANASAIICLLFIRFGIPWLADLRWSRVDGFGPFWMELLDFLWIAGVTLWLVAIAKYFAERDKLVAGFERAAIAKYQFWIQDILIAFLAYGVAVSIVRHRFGFDHGDMYEDQSELIFYCFLELMNHVLAFFVALDVLRVFRFASIPWKRAVFLVLCIGACEAPGYVIVFILAWLACRRAMALQS